MANPLNRVASLGQLPERLLDDLGAIAEAARRIPAIEEMLASIRDTVEPQQNRVAHIESMVEEMNARVVTIDDALGRLLTAADTAVERLPNPDDDSGPLAKARKVIGGDQPSG
jgi:ABC-type Fe2+-enterobactin transport system substrate-binding protein